MSEPLVPGSLSVGDRVHALRHFDMSRSEHGGRAALALARAGELWEGRLRDGWTPSDPGSFPWEMTRHSLAALVPGLKNAAAWRERADKGEGGTSKVVAIVAAGNTPLLSWSPLAACLLAGHSVFVKMSRDEQVWSGLFRDALAEADPVVADRIVIESWPGEDPRTAELCRRADAVVAFGGDATISALMALTPATVRFFGYGNSASVGVVGAGPFNVAGFSRDILLYDQGGCLSPQAIFVEGAPIRCSTMAASLKIALASRVHEYGIHPVTDPAVARSVRSARDMALFSGASVCGDDLLRWTIIRQREPKPLDLPVGHGVIMLLPIEDAARHMGGYLGELRSRLSSAGVVGLTDELRATLFSEGVSRICAPGEMQMPPLDWPNGNRDLLAELAGL